MNGDRVSVQKGLWLLVLLTSLVALVLVARPPAASDVAGNEPAAESPAPIIVVKTHPDGAIECTDVASGPGGEGILLYHWSGPRLQTTRCRPAPAGGLIGLGLR